MAQICHLFVSPLKGESRLLKEMRTAAKHMRAGEITAIGMDDGDASLRLGGEFPYELVTVKTKSWPKSLPFQLIKFVEWTVRAASRARKTGASVIHCHSLPALPASVLAKIGARRSLIYDAHELETRRAGMSPIRQRGAVILERLLMRFADEVFVVSPSIQKHYQAQYPRKKITLLMNMPSREDMAEGVDFRANLGLAPTDKVVIYIGGLAPKRGIEVMLAAAPANPDWHFVFMGSGPLEGAIKEMNGGNVHHHPPVMENEIVRTTAAADLSYCAIDCSVDNHRYALPNKFFQSLAAGVPVIVNKDAIDMREIGESAGTAFLISYDAASLGEVLRSFVNSERRPARISWENQSIH